MLHYEDEQIADIERRVRSVRAAIDGLPDHTKSLVLTIADRIVDLSGEAERDITIAQFFELSQGVVRHLIAMGVLHVVIDEQ